MAGLAVPSAAEIITGMVRAAAAGVLDSEAAALSDQPDGVHQHRTRVRRLRSVLAALGSCVREPDAQRLRATFAEWGAQLGVVRDIEVRADFATAALTTHGIDDPAVWRRLVGTEREEYATAHARLVELAASSQAAGRRYQLEEFSAHPDPVDGDAREVMAGILLGEFRRVRKAYCRQDDSLPARHELRKASRRLRYVAEGIGWQAPGLLEVDALAAAGEAVHDALGDHRDGTLFVDRLRRTRGHAAQVGEPTQPYDILIEDAERDAEERLSRLGPALELMRQEARAIRG